MIGKQVRNIGISHGVVLTRKEIAEDFVHALVLDFRRHGPDTIRRMREKDPVAYVKVIASILPKEHRIDISAEIQHMDDAQLEQRLHALRASLEDQVSDAQFEDVPPTATHSPLPEDLV